MQRMERDEMMAKLRQELSDALAREAALQEQLKEAEEVIAWVLNARHIQEDSIWSSRKAQAYFDKHPPLREDEPMEPKLNIGRASDI